MAAVKMLTVQVASFAGVGEEEEDNRKMEDDCTDTELQNTHFYTHMN